MIQAKTKFIFKCPNCKKEITKEADLNGIQYIHSQKEYWLPHQILYTGQCPKCYEVVYDIKL